MKKIAPPMITRAKKMIATIISVFGASISRSRIYDQD